MDNQEINSPFCRINRFISNKRNEIRIWTLHPKYLDAKGLVAVWREALLAKHVLENKAKGY